MIAHLNLAINLSSGRLIKSLALSVSCILLFSLPVLVHAQDYDLVIKGGHLIDPKNSIDGVMDIAISDGQIARVTTNISASSGERVVDATGLYITPGLIDRSEEHTSELQSRGQ